MGSRVPRRVRSSWWTCIHAPEVDVWESEMKEFGESARGDLVLRYGGVDQRLFLLVIRSVSTRLRRSLVRGGRGFA